MLLQRESLKDPPFPQRATEITGMARASQSSISLLSPISTLKQDHSLAGPERSHVIPYLRSVERQPGNGRERAKEREGES